jgi:hypothetical protein
VSHRRPNQKNNKLCCSVNKNVSKRWTVPLALSPHVEVTSIPVALGLTCPKHVVIHQTAPKRPSSRSPHESEESRYHCIDGTELRHSDEACCPVRKLVSNQRVMPAAPTPAVPTRCPPRSQRPTRSERYIATPYGHPMAVPWKNWRFPSELRRRRQLVGWKKHAHHEEVHVWPADASTRCRGGRGEGVQRENERWTFVCEQQGVFDVLTLSSDPRSLSNNEERCLEEKLVSKRRTVPTALSSVTQVDHSPVPQCTTCQVTGASARSDQPTRSKMRIVSAYGPQMAVSSFSPRFREDSPRRYLGDVECCQNGLKCCSVTVNVSKRWTVPLALSPYTQVTNIPVIPDHTRSIMGIKPSYEPQMAAASLRSRSHGDSCCHHLDGSNRSNETLYEHDDELIRRRQVNPRKNAHREDVHVGSANASTQGQSRGGGEFHRRNEHRWTFVHEEQGALDVGGLDVLVSSSDPRTLRNNKICCSLSKNVSKRRTVPLSLSPYPQVTDSPVSRDQTPSDMRYEPSNGPQTAMFPTIRCPHGRGRYRRLDVSRRRIRNGVRVKRSVSNVEPRTKPEALLALALDPDKRVNSPGTDSNVLNQSGGPWGVCERLGERYTPRKISERHTSRSPVGIE